VSGRAASKTVRPKCLFGGLRHLLPSGAGLPKSSPSRPIRLELQVILNPGPLLFRLQPADLPVGPDTRPVSTWLSSFRTTPVKNGLFRSSGVPGFSFPAACEIPQGGQSGRRLPLRSLGNREPFLGHSRRATSASVSTSRQPPLPGPWQQQQRLGLSAFAFAGAPPASYGRLCRARLGLDRRRPFPPPLQPRRTSAVFGSRCRLVATNIVAHPRLGRSFARPGIHPKLRSRRGRPISAPDFAWRPCTAPIIRPAI